VAAAAVAAAIAVIAWRPAAEQAATAQPAEPKAPPCTPEHLSCGMQRPVPSDGVRPFVNEEFGLRVVFPRGSRVCLTRSGDAPRGFFAIYGADAGCAERPERPPRFIVFDLGYNALFRASLAEVLPDDCRPPGAALRRRIGSPAPAFPGLRSAICQLPSRTGDIELYVYTMAGQQPRRDSSPESRTPYAIAIASLGTTAAHFDEDLARFRRVLASARIRPPR